MAQKPQTIDIEVQAALTDGHGYTGRMTDLPCLTADLPGIGGILKATPDDFVVEEIPAYEPGGTGEHLFLWIEKRDVAADRLVRHLSQTLGVPRDEIGVAGLKDRRAITRQFVSVPARAADRIDDAATESIQILSATRHANKLKTGHLRGNRFSILVRPPHPAATSGSAFAQAVALVNRLRDSGVPNYYGEQRFGLDGETAALGFALLRGEKTSRDLPPAKRKFLLRLALSAAQSELFNRALADRLNRRELRTVLAGDVMRKTATGGLFVAEDVAGEQARLDAGETQITGPLFGPKMIASRGAAAEREATLKESAGLTDEAFLRYPKLTSGTRRPYLIDVPDLTVTDEPEGLRFAFTLPSGAYATVVLREVMKTA